MIRTEAQNAEVDIIFTYFNILLYQPLCHKHLLRFINDTLEVRTKQTGVFDWLDNGMGCQHNKGVC